MKKKNWRQPFTSRARFALGLAFVSAALASLGLMTAAEGQDEKAKTGNSAEQRSEVASSTNTPKVARTKLSGAELYSMHCNRCHPERYPTERTAAQWKTIVMHMRVRANLPAEQARAILKYLQDNSGR